MSINIQPFPSAAKSHRGLFTFVTLFLFLGGSNEEIARSIHPTTDEGLYCSKK